MNRLLKITLLYIMTTSSIGMACPYDKDKIIEITTEEQLQNLLTNSQGPSLISFHMPYCGYCIKMHSILENVANNDLFDHITFYKVDGVALHANIHLKNILNEVVTGYPTILFMHQGKVVSKQVGAARQETIHKHLNNLTAKKQNASFSSKKSLQAAIITKKMKKNDKASSKNSKD